MNLALDVQIALALFGGMGAISAVIGALRMARAATRWRPRLARTAAPAMMPDSPVPFGWSAAWLALKTRDTLGVMKWLDLEQHRQCSWQEGITAVHDPATQDRLVFVSPPVEGWTFVIGLALPHPSAGAGDRMSELLAVVSRKVADAQAYYTVPHVDLYGWWRFRDGEALRRFAAAGAEVLVNEGTLTGTEWELGLTDAAPTAPGVRPALRLAEAAPVIVTEDLVLKLAAAASLDPTQLTAASARPALGFLAGVPASWRQRRGTATYRTA